MSIGIVLAVNNALLLVADGRLSNSFSIIADDAKKIVSINDSLFVIEMGVEIGSRAAIEKLRRSITPLSTAREISNIICSSVREAGDFVLNSLIPNSTDKPSEIKVTLLAGGLDEDGAYLAGAVYGHGMPEPVGVFARPEAGEPMVVILGGEKAGAKQYFHERAAGVLREAAHCPDVLLLRLENLAYETVKFAARHDQTIGGRVQSVILTKDRPPRSNSSN